MSNPLDLLYHVHHLKLSAPVGRSDWVGSPFESLCQMTGAQSGRAIESMIRAWLDAHGFEVERPKQQEECDFILDDRLRLEVKGARRAGHPKNLVRFRYRPLIDGRYHAVLFVGLLPGEEGDHRLWVAEKTAFWDSPECCESDRDGRRGVCVKLEAVPSWVMNQSGSPESAVRALRELCSPKAL